MLWSLVVAAAAVVHNVNTSSVLVCVTLIAGVY